MNIHRGQDAYDLRNHDASMHRKGFRGIKGILNMGNLSTPVFLLLILILCLSTHEEICRYEAQVSKCMLAK
jgi:hypothetical protein